MHPHLGLWLSLWLFILQELKVSNNKLLKFLSNLLDNILFVLFLSLYVLYLVLYIQVLVTSKIIFSGIEKPSLEENTIISKALNQIFIVVSLIYCSLPHALQIYSRIYSNNIQRFIRKIKRLSFCKENYMILVSTLLVIVFIIYGAFNNIYVLVDNIRGSSYQKAIYCLLCLCGNFQTAKIFCLFASATEKISSALKFFNKKIIEIENRRCNVRFCCDIANGKRIIRKLTRKLFSIQNLNEDFYSYFQKPICLMFIVCLLFITSDIIRVATYKFQENITFVLQAIFVTFQILFVSDLINEQVSYELSNTSDF